MDVAWLFRSRPFEFQDLELLVGGQGFGHGASLQGMALSVAHSALSVGRPSLISWPECMDSGDQHPEVNATSIVTSASHAHGPMAVASFCANFVGYTTALP